MLGDPASFPQNLLAFQNSWVNVYGAPEGSQLYYGVSHEQSWFRQKNSEAELSSPPPDELCMRRIMLQIEVPFNASQFTMGR